jgi:hypothetical protein
MDKTTKSRRGNNEGSLKALSPRKCDYNEQTGPAYDKIANEQALLGKDNTGIADALMISVATLKRWNLHFSSFRAAILDGKSIADGRVASALYERAIGFYKTVQQVVVIGTGREESQAQIVDYRQYFPPDTRAIQYWLNNRQAEHWRDKRGVEYSGEMTVTLDLGGNESNDGLNEPEFEEGGYVDFDDVE